MNQVIVNEHLAPGSRILVAPLDWGLGHATRCIPLIREWMKQGHHVTIAGSGAIAALLNGHFPQLEIIQLDGYGINYGKSSSAAISILLQVPRIFRAIRTENRWLKKLLETSSFDLIVSDNRYGLWNRNVNCVIITHQLFIRPPRFAGFMKTVLNNRIRRMIERFNQCWVPDNEVEPSLSGALAHGNRIPKNVRYIGLLSRFDKRIPSREAFPVYDRLILLSGPEPHRSNLERALISKAKSSGLKTLLVQGKPDLTIDETHGSLRIVNHLADEPLKHALYYSGKIVCRSGYSTLMDLTAIVRSAILIPTPGQTEQEYLSQRMQDVFGWVRIDSSLENEELEKIF